MSEWRYLAQRFDGTGNLGDFVDLNLPLQAVEIEETLSGHNSLSATISPEASRLKGTDGRPIFDEWGVCLWAESPNGEVFGGILETSDLEGPEWRVECTDLSGALIGMPFDDATYFVDVDPIDIFRFIWVWYQQRPGCNLAISADITRSGVIIGSNMVQVDDFDQEGGDPAEDNAVALAPSSYASNQEWVAKAVKKLHKKYGWGNGTIELALNTWLDGTHIKDLPENQQKMVKAAKKLLGNPPNMPDIEDPTPTVINPVTYQKDAYKLNWYTNQDLSQVVDDLAAATPFDWHLKHSWSDDGDDADLQHHFRIGYPKLGRRLEEFRFVVGENIHVVPSVTRDGEDYANEVIVLGNGEGAAMKRGRAYRPHPGRMRHTVVVTDQNLMTEDDCNRRAAQELAKRAELEDVTDIVLLDHPNAPAGSVQVGDEFLLEGDLGWIDISVHVRVLSRRFSPDDDSTMSLSVIRTDRLG